ncbi:hypothetical protein L7F22_032486 [Adiantum nelumboides]|nr:hypothetical protein [Adiantum nelumboides]
MTSKGNRVTALLCPLARPPLLHLVGLLCRAQEERSAAPGPALPHRGRESAAGHIWAGHNILKFDILRINEAFSKIGQPAPRPFGVIDTYPLLRRTFGKRAGNYKLATLANYCGFGKQEHRSLADVRMNINVLRSCATMLFLESNYPDIFTTQMEVTTSTSGKLTLLIDLEILRQ